jgi:hypothetical protein
MGMDKERERERKARKLRRTAREGTRRKEGRGERKMRLSLL